MPANPAYKAAWDAYFADHPEVQAEWGHQNGHPPYGEKYRALIPQHDLEAAGIYPDDDEEEEEYPR
jgi:hypothetical protein